MFGHKYIHSNTTTRTCTLGHKNMHANTTIRDNVHVHVYTHAYVCMYVYMCVCVYVCTYILIHTYIPWMELSSLYLSPNQARAKKIFPPVYVSIHVCMYVLVLGAREAALSTYTHTHTLTQLPLDFVFWERA